MELTLKNIADRIGGDVKGDAQITISGINSLDRASHGEISFFFDNRYAQYLKNTKASALLVNDFLDDFPGSQILVTNPKLAYARVAEIFAPSLSGFPGISRESFIHETAHIGENVSIHPMVYVGEDAVIQDNVALFPGVFIGDRVTIGDGSVLYPNVSVLHDCIVGKGVIVHAGAVIGSDGFGFVRDGGENVKIPQLGIVQIDDKVEIGANVTIDRAALGKTWIKKGVKTDNLIQIAHNVEIGENTIIVALSGISGSSQIGRDVVIGGQVGIGDHIKIGEKTMIGSTSGVYKSLSSGEVVSGNPTMPHRLWLKTRGLISRLPQLNDHVRDLEKRVKKLEKLIK